MVRLSSLFDLSEGLDLVTLWVARSLANIAGGPHAQKMFGMII